MQLLEVHPGQRALAPRGLVLAAVWAMAGALAARELGIVGCALAGAVAAVVCVLIPGARVAAVALPAALGALHLPPAQPIWPGEGPVWIDGVVQGAFVRDEFTRLLSFDLVPPGRRGAPVRCVTTLRRGERLDVVLPGDRLRGPAFLRDPTRRIEQGYAPVVEVELGALAISAGPATPRRLATWARLRLEAALREHVPGEAGRVGAHLVLGTGPRLPEDLVDAHRATGLAHLLAVSGAHATILAWLCAAAFAGARGRDPWQARGFRRGCGAFLLGYGAVTGFEPPVLRALCAWLLVATAVARGRRPSVAAALALPALLTAVVAPADLLSISFCLSYAAVIGLAAAGAFRRPEGLRDHLRQAVRASVWAMAATTPLTLAFFGQMSPWTVLGTPLLAPLVAVMLALGVVTAALGVLLPALAPITAAPLGFLTDGYTAAVRLIAELPGAPISALLAPPTLVLIAWALLGAAVIVRWPTRRSIGVACVLASLPHFVGPVPTAPPALILCAVGHGQAAVARLPDGTNVVIDCGNLTEPRRAVRAVERALGGRRAIDLLVVSHADADHAGGVESLARRVPIARAILPRDLHGSALAAALSARGTAVVFARSGEVARPHAAVTVLAPALEPGAPRNDRSLWTVLDCGDGDRRTRVVLPGDAEADGIRAALRDLPAGGATVLVLPHHGRGPTATFELLLDRLLPAACVVSTGGDAPLARTAQARGTPVLSTAEHGAVTVRLDGSRTVVAERPARLGPTRPDAPTPAGMPSRTDR